MNRKPFEFGINMYLFGAVLVQQQSLDSEMVKNYFTKDDPCHIYLICSRPKIFIEPDTFKMYDKYYTITFNIQEGHNYRKLELEIMHPLDKHEEVNFISEFPYNSFQVVGQESGKIFGGDASMVIQNFAKKSNINKDFLDLEVLYVGQSYGNNGSRTAPERLKSHSTLQSIYLESINRNIDKDIWIMLASFNQLNYMMMHKDAPTIEEDKEDELINKNAKVLNTLVNGDFSERQIINFTEAALIKYFEPKYNKEYKNTFPNPAHKTYKECYDLDINSVVVQLGTYDMLKCKLYSEKISTKETHFATFNLHNKLERKSMFDF